MARKLSAGTETRGEADYGTIIVLFCLLIGTIVAALIAVVAMKKRRAHPSVQCFSRTPKL